MSKKKISEFPSAGSLGSGDYILGSQGGTTKKFPGNLFSTPGPTGPVGPQGTNNMKFFERTASEIELTGTTDETVMYSIGIPAGTVSSGDILNIRFRAYKSGENGILTTRVRIGPNDSIDGQEILSLNVESGGVSAFKIGSILNASKSEFGPSDLANDDIIIGSELEFYNIDWTQDQNIVFTLQLQSQDDFGYFKMYMIEVW
jgi:hypothetical protein